MDRYFYRYSCWWEDAVSKCEWESIDTAILTLPKICYSEGYLIEKNKNCLIFTMTLEKHKDSKFILKDIPYGTF